VIIAKSMTFLTSQKECVHFYAWILGLPKMFELYSFESISLQFTSLKGLNLIIKLGLPMMRSVVDLENIYVVRNTDEYSIEWSSLKEFKVYFYCDFIGSFHLVVNAISASKAQCTASTDKLHSG